MMIHHFQNQNTHQITTKFVNFEQTISLIHYIVLTLLVHDEEFWLKHIIQFLEFVFHNQWVSQHTSIHYSMKLITTLALQDLPMSNRDIICTLSSPLRARLRDFSKTIIVTDAQLLLVTVFSQNQIRMLLPLLLHVPRQTLGQESLKSYTIDELVGWHHLVLIAFRPDDDCQLAYVSLEDLSEFVFIVGTVPPLEQLIGARAIDKLNVNAIWEPNSQWGFGGGTRRWWRGWRRWLWGGREVAVAIEVRDSADFAAGWEIHYQITLGIHGRMMESMKEVRQIGINFVLLVVGVNEVAMLCSNYFYLLRIFMTK